MLKCLSRAGVFAQPATQLDFTAAGAGLAGLVSWLVPTRADRDLFFQDSEVLSGWRPCRGLVLAVAWKLGASKSCAGPPSTGLAGLVSWLVPTRADRDLFFQDSEVLAGWGPCRGLVLAVAWKLGASKSCAGPPSTGLAGLVSWLVPTRADRDLFFQDSEVLAGWGPCRGLVLAVAWKRGASKSRA